MANSWDVKPSGGNERAYSRNAQNTGPKSGDKWAEKGDQNLLREGKDDYQYSSAVHHLDADEAGITDWGDVNPSVGKNWKPGPLPHTGDSSPRHAPKGDFGTKSPEAATPTGRYAKPGGKGQRSGA
jgi:hypothetical protein